jgi:hypothetical protein
MTSTVDFCPTQVTATCSALTQYASDLGRSHARRPREIAVDCGNLFKMGERELSSIIRLKAAE